MNPHRGRTEEQRLDDILDAIDAIKHTEPRLAAAERAGDRQETQIAFDAIMYNLVVIGEAVNHVSESTKSSTPGVPWRDIVDMRNFLSHEYFRVLADVVRATLDEPLEQLRAACVALKTGDTEA